MVVHALVVLSLRLDRSNWVATPTLQNIEVRWETSEPIPEPVEETIVEDHEEKKKSSGRERSRQSTKNNVGLPSSSPGQKSGSGELNLKLSSEFLHKNFGNVERKGPEIFPIENPNRDTRDPYRTQKSHAVRGGGYFAQNEYWNLRIGKNGAVRLDERRDSVKIESGQMMARFDSYCRRVDCRAPARNRLIEEHQEIINETKDIARRRNMKAALGALRVKMVSTWDNPSLSMQEKEKALHDLWLACAEDAMGRRAKRAIETFVAERFPTVTLQLFDRS